MEAPEHLTKERSSIKARHRRKSKKRIIHSATSTEARLANDMSVLVGYINVCCVPFTRSLYLSARWIIAIGTWENNP
jgi:hypothetical protein